MGKGYLIDTNAVIDYLDGRLPKKGADLMDSNTWHISVITRIELLGWTGATEKQLTVIQQFISESKLLVMDEPVIQKTIELRKSHRIKLPDAIIAATALTNNLTILTRNLADFQKLDEIDVLDPYSI